MTEEQEEKKYPVYKNKIGAISIAVFEGKFGRTYVLQKGYKKKDETEWKNSSINLYERELKQLLDLVLNTQSQMTMIDTKN